MRRAAARVALAALLVARAARAQSADGAPQAGDVTVRGARTPPGASSMRADEVRETPGAFGDPGRVIEAMPGVTPVQNGLPFFYVRGSTPSDTGYFVDGIKVPFVSHAPPGASSLAPGMIDRVDFFPGAAPARFGRASGGVLSLELRPPSGVARADAGVRMYDSSALVESPLDGGRGAALAAGRYAYTEPLLRLLDPTAQQTYWDYQAAASWKISDSERVGVLAFGARDYAGSSDTGTLFDAQYHRVDLRYDEAVPGGNVRVAATLGVDLTGNGLGDVADRMLGLRVETARRLSPDVRAQAGALVTWDRYTVDVASGGAPDPNILFAPRNDVSFGAYADLAWRATSRFEVDAGARADFFASQRDDHPQNYGSFAGFVPPPTGTATAIGVDPRVATRLRLAPRATWIATFGVAHQPPSFFLPGLVMSRLEDGLQTAVQSSEGIEWRLPEEITVTTTAFFDDYLDLSDPTATCPAIRSYLFDPVNPCFARRVRGRAFGAELSARRALTRRITGWITYTLSRSTREAHAPGETISGESRAQLSDVLSEWDRTHVLTAIAAFDLGAGWRAGARFYYASGRPYSHTVNGVLVPPYDADRLPDFARLDLRLEKRIAPAGDHGRVAIVLEGYNVTFAREATECRPSVAVATVPVPAVVARGPVDRCTIAYSPPYTIPSLGVEGSF